VSEWFVEHIVGRTSRVDSRRWEFSKVVGRYVTMAMGRRLDVIGDTSGIANPLFPLHLFADPLLPNS